MSLIKTPDQLELCPTMKILLYGQPGIGKSTTALSAPAPLLIDCDGGVHRVSAEHRGPTVQVRRYEDVQDTLAKEDLRPFQTIVIDTGGKLLDYMGAWIVQREPKLGKRGGDLSLQGYGARKGEFIHLLKQIGTMGKHIVFVAHEREERDGDERKVRPEIGGSSGSDLIKELDAVGYMEAIGTERTITFNPTEKFYAKNSARLESQMRLPHLDRGTENVFLTTIIQRCQDAMHAESGMAVAYQKLLTDVRGALDGVKTADDLNTVMVALGGQEHVWNSKAVLWQDIQARAKMLSLTFDAKSKQFKGEAAA
jgi:hypothetical protein